MDLKIAQMFGVERVTWQYKAVQATRGSQTILGACILAIIGKQRNTRPQFGLVAKIEKGWVKSDMLTKANALVNDAPLYEVQNFRDELNRLADAAKMNDADRIAMFEEARKWIASDDTPDPEHRI